MKKKAFLKGFLSTIGFLLIVIATLGIAWFSVSAVRFEKGLNNINQVEEIRLDQNKLKFRI